MAFLSPPRINTPLDLLRHAAPLVKVAHLLRRGYRQIRCRFIQIPSLMRKMRFLSNGGVGPTRGHDNCAYLHRGLRGETLVWNSFLAPSELGR